VFQVQQPRPPAQPQHLNKQTHEGVQVPQSKPVDHREVGMLISRQYSKWNDSENKLSTFSMRTAHA
jgi:hypothetical protein